MAQDLRWWAEGDLLDACNCELLCPCHVSFRQKATYDTCEAIWGVNIQRGEWGQTPLDGLKAVIVAFAPGPLMISTEDGPPCCTSMTKPLPPKKRL